MSHDTPALNPDHPMVEFAGEHAVKFIGLMLWKLRRHCPNLAIEISASDMADFSRAFGQGNQHPVVAFTGRRDSVKLQLVDQHTGMVLLAQDGDPNAPNAKMMRRSMEARNRAQSVADRLLAHADNGPQIPPALAREAAEILKLLVWEPER